MVDHYYDRLKAAIVSDFDFFAESSARIKKMTYRDFW
jgi:hypothetical protein